MIKPVQRPLLKEAGFSKNAAPMIAQLFGPDSQSEEDSKIWEILIYLVHLC